MPDSPAKTVKLVNVSPSGDVHVPALGIDVAAGAEVEVPARLAGRAPAWRLATDADDGDPGMYWERRPSDPDDLDSPAEILDPGEGLLAQPDNWRLPDQAQQVIDERQQAAQQPAQPSAPVVEPVEQQPEQLVTEDRAEPVED